MNLNTLINLFSHPDIDGSDGVIDSKLPFAAITDAGIVRRVNSLGKIAWGWSEGARIPRFLQIALEKDAGDIDNDPYELPLQMGGLIVGVIPESHDGGWTLIGYAPRDTSVRDAILEKPGQRTAEPVGPREAKQLTGGAMEEADRLCNEAEMGTADRASFIATLSHEIRSPIGSISGYAELLEKELTTYQSESGAELPELVFEFLSALCERTNSLQRVVQGLFDLSELDKKGFPILFEPVDLHALISLAARNTRSLIDPSKIGVALDLWQTSIHVQSDSERLTQVFEDVLSNAIKFTDSGSITIRSTLARGSAVVEIRDTGIGICGGFLPRIFDACAQEDSGRARQYNGTGMGLTVTRKVLEKLGGSIEVESKKGEGTLVRIRIPLASSIRSDLRAGPRYVSLA